MYYENVCVLFDAGYFHQKKSDVKFDFSSKSMTWLPYFHTERLKRVLRSHIENFFFVDIIWTIENIVSVIDYIIYYVFQKIKQHKIMFRT